MSKARTTASGEESQRELGISTYPGHSVQFYEEDCFLLDGLTRRVGAAIVAGDSVVVIATRDHREELNRRLVSVGLNTTFAESEGRFVCLDAHETLARFMVNGEPDASLFQQVMGGLFSQLASAEQRVGDKIVAYGEMVAVLSAEGRPDAAIRLEQLWNKLAETHSFHLHCAYPMSLFSQSADETILKQICSEHSHITPAERYTSLTDDQERLRAVTLLQQKAEALETEISDRKRLQQALEQREAELRDFVENAVVPMHWVAGDGTILWVNQAELALLGYEASEYVGHHITEFHVDNDAIRDILQRLARREELHGCKALLRRKDGTTRSVRIYSNVYFEGDRFAHTRCLTVDVTERERGERRIAAQLRIANLLAQHRSLSDVFQSILETICGVSECDIGAVWQISPEIDEIKCVRIWNKSKQHFSNFEAATGETRLRRGEGIPGNVWETNQPVWVPDLASDSNFPRRDAAIKDGLVSAFAFPISVQDRRMGVIELFSRAHQPADPELLNMMAAIGIQIGHFIERHQTDDSRNRLAAIVESSDDAIVSKDLNGIVTSWNKAAERIFGFKPEEIIGRSITTIIPPELQDDEPKILARIQAGERIDHFETVRMTKNGDRLDVSLTISPVKDQTGRIVGAAKIARDIGRQKKLEAALRTSERLASVGRLAATVAHEINNPLEAVTNYIYLAKQDSSLPERIQRYLASADRELGRVAHIAQQTLGFYRDNSQPVNICLTEVVDDVLRIYERRFAYKHISVQNDVPQDLTASVLKGELKQVLSNLIANAIDACDDGGRIIIRVRKSSHPRLGHFGIRITIADTGAGIRDRDKARVFEPFFTTKEEVGTGLGLWITKDLLEKRGGYVRFRSRTSQPSGTAFSIFLPATITTSPWTT